MSIQAIGPAGVYVNVGEIYNFTFDVDDKQTPLPVLGSRRIGFRKGQVEINGTIKSYWLNTALHTMVLAATSVAAGGSASSVYHSTLPTQRYNIRVVSSNPSTAYNFTLINCVFEKDGLALDPAKFVDETIPFHAEDIIWNSA